MTTITKAQLRALGPCDLELRLKLFGTAETLSVSAALAAGASVSDILWVAGALGFGAKCAEFAIRCAVSVAYKNKDPRVQKAIDAAKACLEAPSSENARAAAYAAYAAARDAYAAARAAYAADAAAYAAYAAAARDARAAAYAAARAAYAADAAAYAAYAAAARDAYAAADAADAAAYAADAADAAAYAAEQQTWLVELFGDEA